MRDDPNEDRRLFAVTNDPEDVYRLAVMASGHSGMRGNHAMAFDPDDPEVVRELAERLEQEAKRAWERSDALADLRNAESRADVASRHAARIEASYQRQADRERRRAAGGLYAGQRRSANRPTHVEVDAEAWRVVKADAIARWIMVGSAVGALVTKAVTKGLPRETEPIDDGQQTPGRRASRYARLFVDNEMWGRFRAAAVDTSVTTARAVGLVVEADARRLGWSPDGHR